MGCLLALIQLYLKITHMHYAGYAYIVIKFNQNKKTHRKYFDIIKTEAIIVIAIGLIYIVFVFTKTFFNFFIIIRIYFIKFRVRNIPNYNDVKFKIG